MFYKEYALGFINISSMFCDEGYTLMYFYPNGRNYMLSRGDQSRELQFSFISYEMHIKQHLDTIYSVPVPEGRILILF